MSSCGTITLHNTKVCAVAGVLSAGSNCVTAITKEKTQIDFDETVEMLEQGAFIVPADDYIEMKKEIEIACTYMSCTQETKKKLKTLFKNLEGLRNVNANSKSYSEKSRTE